MSKALDPKDTCVLVTGGAGFIGSHTVVQLLEGGYQVVVVDDLSNSSAVAIDRVKTIVGDEAAKNLTFYEANVLDRDAMNKIFDTHQIDRVIHFAGFKAVGESVSKPVEYYHNNSTLWTWHLVRCGHGWQDRRREKAGRKAHDGLEGPVRPLHLQPWHRPRLQRTGRHQRLQQGLWQGDSLRHRPAPPRRHRRVLVRPQQGQARAGLGGAVRHRGHVPRQLELAEPQHMYDVIRLDHFRGFEAYWEVPFSSPDSSYGSWTQGPGLKFFKTLEEKLGTLPIIAEDLGFLTPASSTCATTQASPA